MEMEGVKCSEVNCGCHDFLPFQCNHCNRMYCHDHRSRFVHSCTEDEDYVIVDGSNGNKRDIREVYNEIENRFVDDKQGSATEHFAIKSTPVAEPENEEFKQKIERLRSAEQQSSSQSQRNISRKAREILLKKNSEGNENIDPADRIYLSVNFSATNQTKNLYFSKHLTLAEILNEIMKKYEHMAVVETSRKYGLVVVTADTEDWKLWDRNKVVSHLLGNFEEITVVPMELNEIIRNQEMMQIRSGKSSPTKQEQPLPPMAVPAATEERAIIVSPVPKAKPSDKLDIKKGQILCYSKTLEAEDGQEVPSMIVVEVVGVHHDDFPNIYYTVRPARPLQFLGLERIVFEEKQTTAKYLSEITEEVEAQLKTKSLVEAAERKKSESAKVDEKRATEPTRAGPKSREPSPSKSDSAKVNEKRATEPTRAGPKSREPSPSRPEPARAAVDPDAMDVENQQSPIEGDSRLRELAQAMSRTGGQQLVVSIVCGKDVRQDIPVTSNTTISQLKTLAALLFDFTPARCKLIHAGSTLKEERRTIAEMRIKSGARITVISSK